MLDFLVMLPMSVILIDSDSNFHELSLNLTSDEVNIALGNSRRRQSDAYAEVEPFENGEPFPNLLATCMNGIIPIAG